MVLMVEVGVRRVLEDTMPWVIFPGLTFKNYNGKD